MGTVIRWCGPLYRCFPPPSRKGLNRIAGPGLSSHLRPGRASISDVGFFPLPSLPHPAVYRFRALFSRFVLISLSLSLFALFSHS